MSSTTSDAASHGRDLALSTGDARRPRQTFIAVSDYARQAARDRRLAWIAWGTIATSISPLPAYLLGSGGNSIFLLGCTLFLACFFGMGGRYRLRRSGMALIPVLLTLPAVIYWQELLLALFPIYLVAAMLILVATHAGLLRAFAEAASSTLLVVSLGAWVGFFYALTGGPALFSITNPDGRANDLFLTTFSNWSIGNLIRPAGIFDEPGTLSFLICFTAALRNRLRMSPRGTWVLLGLGLVTTSLAHVLYMLCHALQDRKLLWARKGYLVAAGLIGMTVIWNLELPVSAESTVFLSRFVVEDGKLGGDSRSELLTSALEKIDLEIFLFGLDSDCVVRPAVCANRGYDDFGETPAGMILLLGIFLSAPYFFVLGAALFLAAKQTNLVFVGLFLLLLQRPYVSTFGFSLLILLVIFGPVGRRSARRSPAGYVARAKPA